jgi:hypothetical protein
MESGQSVVRAASGLPLTWVPGPTLPVSAFLSRALAVKVFGWCTELFSS